MNTEIKNPKVLVIQGGFYYFGDLVEAEEGFVMLKNFAMFGGFGGGKGCPGVCSGNKESTVTLDRFAEDETGIFPLSACLGILPSINLYKFKGTTIR